MALFSIFLNSDSLTLLFQYRVPCVLVWPSIDNMGTLDYIEMKHNIMQFNFLFLPGLYFCSISKNLWKNEPPLNSIQIRPFVTQSKLVLLFFPDWHKWSFYLRKVNTLKQNIFFLHLCNGELKYYISRFSVIPESPLKPTLKQ